MNKNIILAFLIIILSSITLLAFFKKDSHDEQQPLNAERINLALRQVGHQLLLNAGDSITRIPPIKNPQIHSFIVHLEHSFNYDSLPVFINRSFATNGINVPPYDVSVWDCEQRELILGFTSIEFSSNKKITCSGRDMLNGCYNFMVTFNTAPPQKQSFLNVFLIGLLLTSIGTGLYFFNKNKEKLSENIETSPDDLHLVGIGNSIFNTQKPSVTVGDIEQNLTYREAKLLQLFCQHQNELLDRDFILKEVWHDEGILVGRSLDVFVSRLRKLLKNDESLKISSVHGRGYRFEVSEK